MPVSDHPCGYTCIGNGCFLKHLAYASQVFKDDYVAVLQQGTVISNIWWKIT